MKLNNKNQGNRPFRISDEEYEDFMNYLEEVEEFINAQRKSNRDKTEIIEEITPEQLEWCEQILQYAKENPEIVPPDQSLTEFEEDIKAVKMIGKLKNNFQEMTDAFETILEQQDKKIINTFIMLYGSIITREDGEPDIDAMAYKLMSYFKSQKGKNTE